MINRVQDQEPEIPSVSGSKATRSWGKRESSDYAARLPCICRKGEHGLDSVSKGIRLFLSNGVPEASEAITTPLARYLYLAARKKSFPFRAPYFSGQRARPLFSGSGRSSTRRQRL